MNDRLIYRRLEWTSFALLLIIAVAIVLIFLESISLTIFKITLVILLLFAFAMFLLLRRTLTETIRQGKQRFKSAEYKFDKLYESDVIGILISTRDGVVLEANDAFLNMVGYSRSDLTHFKILWNEVITDEPKGTENPLKRLEGAGNYKPVEKQLERKDGSKLWGLCGSAALYDKDEGDIVSYIIDITQKKEADEKAAEYESIIKAQEEEFKSVFLNAPAFISIRRGPDLRFVFVNKFFERISQRSDHLGKTHEEVYGDIISFQDQSMAKQVFETGKQLRGTRYKINYKDDDGDWRVLYLDYVISPVFDNSGKVDGVAFFGYEVTDLVTANQDLELSKNQFAFLADTMPHKVWITDAEGNLQYVNKAWMEYANISNDTDPAIWSSIIHPDESEQAMDAWSESLSRGTEFNMESRLTRHDGEYRWHLSHAVPFKDNHGQIVYWVGINTDIHDSKMQVQHLMDNEAYFRNLSEETPFIVWKTERGGKCVYLNHKWTEFTGLPVEESLGFGFRKAILIDDIAAYRQNWMETLKTHALYQEKFRLRTADGEYRWVFSQGNPHYVNSRFEGYVGSIVDITEQELSSQAIKELSEKKDEFLSIASHELKTPLTSIKASIQLIARAISTDSKVSQFAVKASEQLIRLERLISDLLDVSKINSGRLIYNNTVFYFREMVREVVQSIQHTTTTHKIIIERSDKVILLGDRFRLEQVLYNFISNAIKYSPQADKVIVNCQIKENDLVVSVQDFGIGIAPENLSKAFDRYYRVDDTAMRFQGLGLGLFISADILKRHNGNFWIESELGKGSTFFFSLPLNDPLHAIRPETDHRSFYKDSKIEIRYDPEKHWLEAYWHGFQNFETIKHGCLKLLDLLEKTKSKKVLNDNTHILGNWSEASEWGGKIWLPAMEISGLRHFAWVHSESAFSKLAASRIANFPNGQVTTRFFESKEEAVIWLENVNSDSIQDTPLTESDAEMI
ncbi:PAS domain S-box protein [Flavihumibacter sp. R14]|nr:PAS domain S-box protein [Flavihumibacter soli]